MKKLNPKRRRQSKETVQVQASIVDRSLPPRRTPWLVTISCIVVAAGVTFFIALQWMRPNISSEFVGNWHVQSKQLPEECKLVIQDNGMFRLTVTGEEKVVEGRVTVNANSLHFITINPHTRQEDTKSHTIKGLSGQQISLEDAYGGSMNLIRIPD